MASRMESSRSASSSVITMVMSVQASFSLSPLTPPHPEEPRSGVSKDGGTLSARGHPSRRVLCTLLTMRPKFMASQLLQLRHHLGAHQLQRAHRLLERHG